MHEKYSDFRTHTIYLVTLKREDKLANSVIYILAEMKEKANLFSRRFP